MSAQYLHRRQSLHSLRQLRRRLPGQMYRDGIDRSHSLDRWRRRARRNGSSRTWSTGGGDADRRAALHPLRVVRRLVSDGVPDDGSLPPHTGSGARERRSGGGRRLESRPIPAIVAGRDRLPWRIAMKVFEYDEVREQQAASNESYLQFSNEGSFSLGLY